MWFGAVVLSVAVVLSQLVCDAAATRVGGGVETRLRSGGAALHGSGGKVRAGSSQCASPVAQSSTLGCVDFMGASTAALDLVAATIDSNGVGGDPTFLNQFLRPVLGALKYSVKKSFPGVSSNVCLGNFLGSALGNSALGVDKCSMLPLGADDEYMVFSFSLPVAALPCESFAKTSPPGTMASMCLALSLCGAADLPTLGAAFDHGMLGCLFGVDELVVATEGVALLVSQLGSQTVDGASVALSLSDNLEQAITVYDTTGLVTVPVKGNFGATMDLAIDSKKVGLPECLELHGVMTVVVSLFGNPQRSTVFASNATNIKSVLMGLTNDFSLAVTGQADLAVKLGDISRGVFPDLEVALGSVSALMSMGSKAEAGVDQGFYVYAEGGDVGAAVVTSVIETILPLVDAIIDGLFGKGATDLLVQYATPDDTSSTKLGLGINTVQAGLYLEVPIASALAGLPPFSLIPGISMFAGSLEFDLRIRLADAAVSFFVKYHTSGFFTMLWQDLLLVWRKVVAFFEEVGEIIVAVSQKALVFTEQAIQKCAADINAGVYEVDDDLKNWAQVSVSAVVDTSKIVEGGVANVGETIKNGIQDVGHEIAGGLTNVVDKVTSGLADKIKIGKISVHMS
jgi:hypothetical protein